MHSAYLRMDTCLIFAQRVKPINVIFYNAQNNIHFLLSDIQIPLNFSENSVKCFCAVNGKFCEIFKKILRIQP